MIISEASDFPRAVDFGSKRCAPHSSCDQISSRAAVPMRPALVQRLLQLYALPRMPMVRADTAFGTADLTPLSQLSIALLDVA